MLIKSIEIKNFRQFKDIKLSFSIDSQKNVSIISGNNGAGKTTLAEAFTWCLYGEISNTKNDLLNKEKIKELQEGYSTDIVVKIKLEHEKVKYEIIRKQTFLKNKYGGVTSSKQSKEVLKTLENGITVPVMESGIDDEIDRILPKNLSRYFFSSGERIDSMGKSLEKGGKNSDFSQAVKSLLGLAPFIEAKDHLSIVQKKYKDSCQTNGDEEIIKLKENIVKREAILKKNEIRLKEIEEIIETKKRIIENNSKELSKYEETKETEERIKKSMKLKEEQEKFKFDYEKDIIKLINRDILDYMSQYYIKEAKKNLEKYDFADKDIPNLHSKTIDYLIKRGYCLCGHKIEENSEEYKTLIKLKDDLPPNSIGISVNNFIKDSRSRILKDDFYKNIKNKYKRIETVKRNILDYETDIENLKKKLLGNELQNKIRQLSNERNNAELEIKKLSSERDKILIDKGRFEREVKGLESKLEKEQLKYRENRRILFYKKYVDSIYEKISEELDDKEKKLRNELEKEVDTIFNFIYNGGLHIAIDDKYNISTTENINISTGQSQAIILSFIAGIIKLAKENMNEEKEEIYTQAYPLVMDAPLSVFDKTVIKNICDLIPNIAEQVIIFIKDVDGEIAERYMQEKIGMKAKLIKINEHHTKIEE